MSAWVLSLASYESWPLMRVAWLLLVAAVLVVALLPVLVVAVLLVRGLVATERAALRIPSGPGLVSGGVVR